MQSASRSRILSRLGTFGLAAVLVVLAGCSSSLGPAVPGTGPLVSIKLEGGMCPEGMCQAAWVIHADGRITTAGDAPQDVGRADGAAMTALAVAVRSTDYRAIRSRPFTGTCPVAFDGQEVVLEFHAPEGVQRIASCETEIDWSHPLFAATLAALGDAVSIPTEF